MSPAFFRWIFVCYSCCLLFLFVFFLSVLLPHLRFVSFYDLTSIFNAFVVFLHSLKVLLCVRERVCVLCICSLLIVFVCACVYSLDDENSILCGVKTGTNTHLIYALIQINVLRLLLLLLLLWCIFKSGTESKIYYYCEGNAHTGNWFLNIVQVNQAFVCFSRSYFVVYTQFCTQIQWHIVCVYMNVHTYKWKRPFCSWVATKTLNNQNYFIYCDELVFVVQFGWRFVFFISGLKYQLHANRARKRLASQPTNYLTAAPLHCCPITTTYKITEKNLISCTRNIKLYSRLWNSSSTTQLTFVMNVRNCMGTKMERRHWMKERNREN